jgi:tRNA-dihydrouridine synthase A
MMDWTDRHYRYMMRQLTRRTLLYSEMVTTGAILYGDRARHLDFSPEELPLALQLGGDDPQALAECARIGADWGYSEINLNVGCPSARVQNGNFGACLMAEPNLVARCVAAMKRAVSIPVTVKHRIGIDALDRYEDLHHFVQVVSQAGADRFTVHARKAWLKGLSPKENRTLPPLRYAEVYRLKAALPHLTIELNGGVTSLQAVETHLQQVDAVMIGRAAYDDPYLFATVDQRFFSVRTAVPSRREVIEGMLPYIAHWTECGTYLKHISRHMLGLFKGQPGAKGYRRRLSEQAHRPEAGVETVLAALACVPAEVQTARAPWSAAPTSQLAAATIR